MHLLAVIEAYSITGPAKNLIEFARHARDLNVLTTFVTFTRGSATNLFIETVRKEGIPIEIIDERRAFDVRAASGLREIALRLQPDVIQTHAVKSHFLARAAGLPKLAPWVAFHHGYTWPNLKAKAFNQLDRWSLRAAKRLLTVSRPFRDELVSFGIPMDRIEIVHNAIPAEWGRRAGKTASEAGIPAGRKVILIVGRLSREKDHATLLESVSRLRSDLDVHLVIVGDGPERSRLERDVGRLGLGRHVTFTGQQNSAEPWYALTDVAVLSSLSEGSPNALLEAMSANVPVVATAVGGIPEIVTHGESALLIQPRDVVGMETAIRRLLTEPELAVRFTKRSRQLIQENHDPVARTQKLIAIYRALSSS